MPWPCVTAMCNGHESIATVTHRTPTAGCRNRAGRGSGPAQSPDGHYRIMKDTRPFDPDARTRAGTRSPRGTATGGRGAAAAAPLPPPPRSRAGARRGPCRGPAPRPPAAGRLSHRTRLGLGACPWDAAVRATDTKAPTETTDQMQIVSTGRRRGQSARNFNWSVIS